MIYKDFEDILIKPEIQSRFTSRSQIKLTNELNQVPVCAANMHGVGTVSMALELQKFKMITFLNKEIFIKREYLGTELFKGIDFNYAIPTFGISNRDLEGFDTFFSRYRGLNEIKYICIDVANGHMEKVIEIYRYMQSKFVDVKFIVGNIANPEALKIYNDEGIYCASIGIGSGSVCTTRIQTGIGVPQATLIKEMVSFKENNNLSIKIMSDGGIKEIGDITKALVMGSDYVMIGGMFSGYSQGNLKTNDNGKIIFKGSSAGQSKDYVVDEGIYVEITPKGSVGVLCRDIMGGLRSAGTYLDSHLDGFKNKRHLLIKTNRQKNNIYDNQKL